MTNTSWANNLIHHLTHHAINQILNAIKKYANNFPLAMVIKL